MQAHSSFDITIIGGGIVGLSSAWQLQQAFPEKRILLLEKEPGYAQHQTGHNSGVIHAGVYYQPGSLKARFCKEGAAATLDFCRHHHLPVEQCGKLLVATHPLELKRMNKLQQRCKDNGIEVEKLSAEQLLQREPNIKGLGALFVAATGIADYGAVSRQMAANFVSLGGRIELQSDVQHLRESASNIEIRLRNGCRYHTGFLISCGGLMADRLTRLLNIDTDFRIVPFRGEYFRLPERLNNVVRHLIYPIPDPDLPFLGVHLTRMIDGSVTIGPNAVVGWKREGYGQVNFNLRDTAAMLTFPGFWKVGAKHWRSGINEWKNSWHRYGYLELARKYCPQLTLADLQPYPTGIRAQAVLSDGTLVHDFLFHESPRSLHVCNAPSPAATSAIPIGRHIVERVTGKLIG
jgi:L-2-hydroxyglutarate oxidase